ncbi:MAG: response regulator [Lachnospiraceae bacterium]|nr:response regulator [Lachnospiraceae bacterium]
MRFLLVDDEAMALAHMEVLLQKIVPGCDVLKTDDYRVALQIVENESVDVAFLDILMPEINGIDLAKMIVKKKPRLNIVFVTADNNYTMEAFELYASGYIMKPISPASIRNALKHLRYRIDRSHNPKLRVVCFGQFDVFLNGRPVKFSRNREKEVLAYLVDKKGSSCTIEQMCECFFNEDLNNEGKKHLLRNVISDLRKDLREIGMEDLLVGGRNSYGIDLSMIECDYIDYMKNPNGNVAFWGKYMSQYPWAEETEKMLLEHEK